MSKPLVLLVDNDPEGRGTCAGQLVASGFQVEQAHNGLQAFERAIDRRPDAIVTELHLPGIDGYELTRRLKSDPRTASVPVLAVTGYEPFTRDLSRADRAGCDAVLIKPVDPVELDRTLHALIQEARRRRTA